MSSWRRLAQGLLLFGSWALVQVPAKDIRLDDPGSNDPPISQFKLVRQFDSAGECEAYRDFALQDSAEMGSEAMLDQTSQLRCVAVEALTPKPAVTPSP